MLLPVLDANKNQIPSGGQRRGAYRSSPELHDRTSLSQQSVQVIVQKMYVHFSRPPLGYSFPINEPPKTPSIIIGLLLPQVAQGNDDGAMVGHAGVS